MARPAPALGRDVQVSPKTTPYEKAAWLAITAGFLFVLVFHRVPALLTGLLVNALLHRLARRMTGRRFSHATAKVLAAVLLAVVALSIATGAVLGLVGLARGHLGSLPALFQKMAEVLDSTQGWLEQRGAPQLIPEAARDARLLRGGLSAWLRDHAAQLQRAGSDAVRFVLDAAIGMVIGLLVFFHRPAAARGPLALAFHERLGRLEWAFEAVVFAQVKISAINTALTALYLLVVLPLFGVHLPLAGTLVAVTFLTGMLPVIGNLLSNSVIVIISLGVSGAVALASLGFLIAIHKLEYLTNAKIVGGEVHAAAWEILLALFAFEAAFGVPGLVLAPIVYAYAKKELVDRELL